MNRTLAVLLTVGALAWSGVILAAPVALASAASVRPATLVYAGAARICHQRPERSFRPNRVQMPVCARCTGLYLSGAAGALIAWGVRARRLPARTPNMRWVLLIAALPTAATFTLEVLGFMAVSNALRATAALPLGAAAGWFFVRMLRYDARVDGDKIHHG
ncbi:MAG TPA: DUF2085 domain-containing protein [Gemmatimonadaceae bacterium]|nr:DUF2085 domain-containing protein [Gemmatimonadaceae bacterium]